MRPGRIVAAVIVVAGGAMVPGPPALAQAPTGEIVDFEILPPVLEVQVGDTITWTNNGERPHTVTDRGGMFDTNPILPGTQAGITVTVPGTYEVFCRINPSRMNARVVVAPGPEPPAVVRVQALDEAREGETLRFDPPEVEVVAGGQLVLANAGGLPHSLRADDGSFRIPVVEPGAEQGRFAGGNGTVIVSEPGTYGFFCDIHPDVMRGTLTVIDTSGGDEEERAPPETEAPTTTAEVAAADATATFEDFAFEPVETVVEPGSTVTWQNAGETAHTATFDDIDIDTGPVQPGESATATAPEDPGTYSYRCSIHPQRMRGVLLVRAPATAVPIVAEPDDPTDGTVFAYALGVLFVGTAVAGLTLGLRKS